MCRELPQGILVEAFWFLTRVGKYLAEDRRVSKDGWLVLLHFNKEMSVWLPSCTHIVELSLGVHVGVAVTPVEGDLLLLPLIEPDQLLGAVSDERVQALQAPQAP